MFTLTYTNSGEPVYSPFAEGEPERVFSCNHAMTARQYAKLAAKAANGAVTVVRAGTPSYVVHPDGSTGRMPNAPVSPREDCRRDKGEGPCFCTACREDRKAGKSYPSPNEGAATA